MNKSELRERFRELSKKHKVASDQYVRELKKLLRDMEKAEAEDFDLYIFGRINLNLALCCFDLGIRSSILGYAVKAADVFERLKNREMITRSYNILGIAYGAQGNYLRAIDYYNRALEAICGVKKPALRRDVMLNNIAEAYYLMGEYQKSTRILKNCIEVVRTKSPNDHMNVVIYSINLSDDYESLGEFENAIQALDDALSSVEKLDREVLIWGYYIRRCCVLYKLGNLSEAEKYADLAINAVKSGYDSYEFHRDFEKISKLELQNGDFDRAQAFADILTEYADTNKHTIDLIISKRVQARICLARGEDDRALSLYRELNGLYERRMREQNEIQYESQKNVEAASREIAKLMQSFHATAERAERDALTGLRNRAALVSVTNEFLQLALERKKKLGGIFIDIDLFKGFNDTYGHAAGDEAIKYVAKMCLEAESPTVKFFRYGGDEFFGVVLGCEDKALEQLAIHISEAVRGSGIEHIKNPNGQRLTVSVGVVNLEINSTEHIVLDVINHADKALYHAKESGRDAVCAVRPMPDEQYEYRFVSAK